LGPGELIASLDTIVRRTGVSRSTVNGALNGMEKDGMVRQSNPGRGRCISIVNWDRYQGDETESETDVEHIRNESRAQTVQYKKKEEKNKNKESLFINRRKSLNDFPVEIAELTLAFVGTLDFEVERQTFLNWAATFEKCVTIDGRKLGELRRVTLWARQDYYFRSEFYTPKYLRENNGRNYDRILEEMKEEVEAARCVNQTELIIRV
jgi:DNA-binding transcriptional regulator YhcF (GntR family)